MTDQPSSDLPSGVGLTAVGVAYIRASESQRPDRLFDDTLAARFVEASGWSIPTDQAEADEAAGAYWAALQNWVIVRTRFLDDFLRDAADAGCRQVVLLGAGLDTRAFRLQWPRDVRLFEVDLPDVLDFKEGVLDECAAVPRCARTPVRADLLGDWVERLRAAGFGAAQPTAWVAEGLLIYLTQDENELLLARASDLSAPGSRLGITLRTHHEEEPVVDQSMTGADGKREPTFRTMWKSSAPDDPAGWLRSHGWRAHIVDASERAMEYGRPMPPQAAEYSRRSLLVSAERP